jgi:hypothetical protein
LLQEHITETRVRLVHVNRAHKLFDVMVHRLNHYYIMLSVSDSLETISVKRKWQKFLVSISAFF